MSPLHRGIFRDGAVFVLRKGSPFGGNGDDRRQRRKQGGAVGAAASRMQATAQQTLGAATRPWRAAPERARPLARNHRHSDSIALTEGLLIAAWQLCPAGLALSVCFAATSPIGRGFCIPQSPRLPLWGSWRVAPERARPLTRNHRHSDSIALTEGLLIAAWQLCPAGLALSVCFAATSPIGRGFCIPQSPRLPLWGSWRVAPERARPLTRNRRHSDSIALTKGLHPDEFPLIMYNFFEM